MLWRRLTFVCVAAINSIPSSLCSPFHASKWICNLESNPIVKIALPQDGEGLRALSSGIDNATRRSNDNSMERRTRGGSLANAVDQPETAEDNGTVYQEVRKCICDRAGWRGQHKDVYYCPTPMNYCSVWKQRWSDEDYTVGCFETTGNSWKINFARYIWYYLLFAILLVVLCPIWTEPGRVSCVCCPSFRLFVHEY